MAQILCVSLRLKNPSSQNSYLPEAEATKQPQKRRGEMPHVRQKRRFPYRILANGHGVRHPRAQEVVGVRAGFDRIYRINRIEGRQEERGRRGNHAEIAKGERELRLVARLR